ncbi:hypothetical protein M2459_001910 [Parabacteroides sp. PF5-5]|uniref:3-keto-disaccharide hydrolase n=1 Tax=unclassified Parabacteroides TaxID=2649774 RepID=UPI002473B291|nr:MULTISPECIES: DUF1080 domain-containing protein [unclassified Parabacteroides]MDH6305457.1 hypothetical protein [Parabacteroides sp. PH5-39]MDH6316167.1 hypothetical protein [Parabacteroides sp. PF5-13]MDH6320317.1 hypothetical protein [Parabacteroides sp. PH5-13]MDH6324047.1 hypothetical protein [Parabacteroides sp. PH5-8]MDH6327358.1 hypothetical protein [Parabacteroides sp. PH5-41]
MKYYISIICLLFLPAFIYAQSVLDNQHHGDPSFLLEDGWKPLINGKNMKGWKYQDEKKANTWTATKAVYWDQKENPKLLVAKSASGDRIVNLPREGGAANIISTETAGDMELYVEFMIPQGSNSGVYVHGLYELQIWDSYGKEPRLQTDKTGALYHYIDRKTIGIDGQVIPLVRAERPHGQWNAYHIWFRAPRFDASGKKIENAKFIKVLLNGELIHENQERIGATTAALEIPEAAKNPVVMLQGDHGSVAFRNIYVKPLK